MSMNMRTVLALAIWLGSLSLEAAALHLMDPRSFGQQGPLFMLSAVPGLLLMMIARLMVPESALYEGGPAPRRVQLTRKAVFLIPAWGLISMFALIPTVAASGQVARHFHGSQEPLLDLAILAGAGIPLAILVYALTTLRKHRRLVRIGTWAEGVVTEPPSKGRFAYQFSAADGEMYTKRESAHVDVLSAGSSVDVFYDPLVPRRSVAGCGSYFEPWSEASQLPLRPARLSTQPPLTWKWAAVAVSAGVLVFALFDHIIYGRWHDASGSATFHPTAGVFGRGEEEVVLQLPPGWQTYYNAHQPWRSADLVGPEAQHWTLNLPMNHHALTLLSSGAAPALGITVDLENQTTGSPETLASYAEASLVALRGKGATISCEPNTKPSGEALLCLVSATASESGRPRVSHRYFERTKGMLLAITLRSHPSRTDALASVAREILMSVQVP